MTKSKSLTTACRTDREDWRQDKVAGQLAVKSCTREYWQFGLSELATEVETALSNEFSANQNKASVQRVKI